jgi:hypothetical protein
VLPVEFFCLAASGHASSTATTTAVGTWWYMATCSNVPFLASSYLRSGTWQAGNVCVRGRKANWHGQGCGAPASKLRLGGFHRI